MVRRTETMVQLNEELLAVLDRKARESGVSRSQLIRQALEAYLASDREAELDRQIVEGYTRMPQGGEFDRDEWGDVGAMMNALAAESLRTLDGEERAAGFDPW
ncbi:MAG TPA: CopG family transcriptional regulator [Actinomycetota bacterium]|nr:CopG family transcriptional regulator [Actinomycetota bacterium]